MDTLGLAVVEAVDFALHFAHFAVHLVFLGVLMVASHEVRETNFGWKPNEANSVESATLTSLGRGLEAGRGAAPLASAPAARACPVLWPVWMPALMLLSCANWLRRCWCCARS